MNLTWSNSLGKVGFWGVLCGIQILKVTYMSYLGKVFENLTNKVQLFSKTQNFTVFLGLRSELESQFEKTETTENFLFGSILSYFIAVCLLKLLIMFFYLKELL